MTLPLGNFVGSLKVSEDTILQLSAYEENGAIIVVLESIDTPGSNFV